MTDRPCRPIKLGRIQIQFFVKRAIEHTQTQQLKQSPAPLTLSTPEATVFDLIRYAHAVGGIERVAETILPMLPALRPIELKRVLKTENIPAIAQRLGFILDSGGAKKTAQIVHDWLPAKLTQIPLSPIKGDHQKIPLVKRWQVLNNSNELKS